MQKTEHGGTSPILNSKEHISAMPALGRLQFSFARRRARFPSREAAAAEFRKGQIIVNPVGFGVPLTPFLNH
jgi:hypothetical protein